MRRRWLGLWLAALAAALSLWAYPRLPLAIATHWNAAGEPNGYSSRGLGVALFPLAILGLTFLLQVLPKLDPRGQNYTKFTDTYWLIGNAVALFLLALHALIIANGLGYRASVARVVPVTLGLLLIVLGNYLTRVEPNWFVGIRTPWTLSSDAVWRQTHRTGSRVFVLGGFAVIAESALPLWGQAVAVAATLTLVALVPIVQSYVLWRREHPDRQ